MTRTTALVAVVASGYGGHRTCCRGVSRKANPGDRARRTRLGNRHDHAAGAQQDRRAEDARAADGRRQRQRRAARGNARQGRNARRPRDHGLPHRTVEHEGGRQAAIRRRSLRAGRANRQHTLLVAVAEGGPIQGPQGPGRRRQGQAQHDHGGNSIGGASHIATLLLAQKAAIQPRIVQVGDGPKRLQSVLGGHTAYTVVSPQEYKGFQGSGIRALAVIGAAAQSRMARRAVDQGTRLRHRRLRRYLVVRAERNAEGRRWQARRRDRKGDGRSRPEGGACTAGRGSDDPTRRCSSQSTSPRSMPPSSRWAGARRTMSRAWLATRSGERGAQTSASLLVVLVVSHRVPGAGVEAAGFPLRSARPRRFPDRNLRSADPARERGLAAHPARARRSARPKPR